MRYQTFDLTISASDSPQEYLLSAQTSHHGETPAPVKTPITLNAETAANLFGRLEENKISPAELQALGKRLYESLFVGEINLLLNRALGETVGHDDCGLRLRLRLNPPELAALPWEFLYSPERQLFLAASVETPLSRYLNLPEPIRALACPEEIRLLAVIPQNSGLDTVAEREMLEKTGEKLKKKLAVDFIEGLATGAAIRAALREKEYHIFHYAGHGAFKNDEAFLYLDHEERFTEPITAAQFAHFFTDYPFMRLVVLNACKGAARSAHQALTGAAPQLVLRGVPAVIAMQYRLANEEAILFATEFYAELCSPRDGGQAEVAMSRARKALLQERFAHAVFGNPVLYLRAADGRLWEEQKAPTVSPPAGANAKEQNTVLESVRVGLGVVNGILSMLKSPGKTKAPDGSDKAFDLSGVLSGLMRRTLKGQIKDESGLPLPGVTVMLPEVSQKTTTDEMGAFHFEALKSTASTWISFQAMKEGYKPINGALWPNKPLLFNRRKMKRLK